MLQQHRQWIQPKVLRSAMGIRYKTPHYPVAGPAPDAPRAPFSPDLL